MKIFLSLLIVWISISAFQQPEVPIPIFQLIVFTGSDWCVKCQQLEKNILDDAALLETLQENNIEILRVDFPQRTKQSAQEKVLNQKIAEQYNFGGTYPTVLLARADTIFYKKIKIAGNDPTVFQLQIMEKLESLSSPK